MRSETNGSIDKQQQTTTTATTTTTANQQKIAPKNKKKQKFGCRPNRPMEFLLVVKLSPLI
jgi:hypothetical protein